MFIIFILQFVNTTDMTSDKTRGNKHVVWTQGNTLLSTRGSEHWSRLLPNIVEVFKSQLDMILGKPLHCLPWAGHLDKITSRGPFQTQPFHNYANEGNELGNSGKARKRKNGGRSQHTCHLQSLVWKISNVGINFTFFTASWVFFDEICSSVLQNFNV